jgi:trimethylamine:corrinoid methyltransferase-like protein
MVMDDEFIAGLRRMMEGITTHDLDEEIALIKSNTPRGNFLKSKHTRRHFLKHWQPGILSRDTYETWQTKGETIEQLCRQKVKQTLDHHRPPQLPATVEADIERIVRRYKPDFFFE